MMDCLWHSPDRVCVRPIRGNVKAEEKELFPPRGASFVKIVS